MVGSEVGSEGRQFVVESDGGLEGLVGRGHAQKRTGRQGRGKNAIFFQSDI